MKFKQLCTRTQSDMPGTEWFPMDWAYPAVNMIGEVAWTAWWRRSSRPVIVLAASREIFGEWDVAWKRLMPPGVLGGSVS